MRRAGWDRWPAGWGSDLFEGPVQDLIDDLKQMEAVFAKDGPGRKRLLSKPEEGLAVMFTGLGSLSYGELAGERTKLGLILHDPEEEHDCFSDNTHNSHFYDELGITELWRGHYTRLDGRVIGTASIRDYAAAKNPAAAKRMDDAMNNAMAKIKLIKDMGDSGRMAYDQMIASGNAVGNKLVQDAIDAHCSRVAAELDAARHRGTAPRSAGKCRHRR